MAQIIDGFIPLVAFFELQRYFCVAEGKENHLDVIGMRLKILQENHNFFLNRRDKFCQGQRSKTTFTVS